MNTKTIKGEWAGCSDFNERREKLLKAHEEFQRMLNNGYQIKVTGIKYKRPRIQKKGFKIVMVFGKPMKLTIQEYNDHWNFKIEK